MTCHALYDRLPVVPQSLARFPEYIASCFHLRLLHVLLEFRMLFTCCLQILPLFIHQVPTSVTLGKVLTKNENYSSPSFRPLISSIKVPALFPS